MKKYNQPRPEKACAVCLYAIGFGYKRVGAKLFVAHNIVGRWLKKKGVSRNLDASRFRRLKPRELTARNEAKRIKRLEREAKRLTPEQRLACFHYSNLQPLWAEDNMKKSDTITPTQQELCIAL